MPTAIPRVLADLSRVFRTQGLRWYVFGAQAVAAWGVPRLTADVDVTVAASRQELSGLVAALQRDFAVRPVGDVDSFIAQSRVIPLIHRRTETPVDVVLAGPGLEDAMLERAQTRIVGRIRVPFIEINDLLVVKFLAGRPKDLEDIRGLLRVHAPELNTNLVRERLGELAAAIDDSTLVPAWDALLSNPAAPTAWPRPSAKTKPTKQTKRPRR